MISRLLPSVLAVVLTLAPWQAKAADALFPVGSLVGLAPPAGMVASRTFSGFEDREKKAGIAITQLPGEAYEQFLEIDEFRRDRTARRQQRASARFC